jgi:hypothetical protein
MANIKTGKFHLVDGIASEELRGAIETSQIPIPPSYKGFILRFGNAKFYRRGSIYMVQVLAAPHEAKSDNGEPLLHFGQTDLSLAYFKEALLVNDCESPIFEWRHQEGLKKMAGSFEEWLNAKCAAARNSFSKKQWEAVERGPSPFTEQETAIVEARKKFRWRVLGVSTDGNLRFEVYNGSTVTLPFLSVGIRGVLRPPNTGPLNGGVWLPVSSVCPGQTKIIEKDCYKKLVDPEKVDVFDHPDPQPEDRDRYWEFKALSGGMK